ncbi:MAG: Uncharacterised protein [Formosa sp. Hel3_A1_48]|nr:MAG: Uncharacterised protein [Formosa sp. Hel3_A1_48]
MKKLQNYGVQELNAKEMTQKDGGWLLPLLGGAIIYEIITDWDHFKDGLGV